MLQCDTARSNDLLPVSSAAVYCSVLQHVAACCSVLQCDAVDQMNCRLSIQLHVYPPLNILLQVCVSPLLQCVAVCCSVLQRVPARSNKLSPVSPLYQNACLPSFQYSFALVCVCVCVCVCVLMCSCVYVGMRMSVCLCVCVFVCVRANAYVHVFVLRVCVGGGGLFRSSRLRIYYV